MSEVTGGDAPVETMDNAAIMKQQEEELAKKYPGLMKKGKPQNLLPKKMHKQQKYFDSGDYNVTKSKLGHKQNLSPTEKTMLTESTGNAIPTPDAVHKPVTHRTSSLVQDEPVPQPTD